MCVNMDIGKDLEKEIDISDEYTQTSTETKPYMQINNNNNILGIDIYTAAFN